MTTDDDFLNDYITYDKYGIVEIRCMACNAPIKTRAEIPSKINPGSYVYALARHADYREFFVILGDGSISSIMVCDSDKNLEITEDLASRLTNQIYKAKILEMDHTGYANDIKEAVLSNYLMKKKVIRRLTPDEIRERFGGTK